MATPNLKARLNRDGVIYLAREFAHLLLHLALLLAAAGTLQWINAWVMAGLNLIHQAVNTLVLLRFNPGLLNQRAKLFQEGTKRFDKWFIALYLPLGVLISILCGLDAVRFGWSHLPLAFIFLGMIIYIAACALGLWAMAVNAHFEVTVLIRKEQRVCASGPYRIVRHPGYAAAIIGSISYPLILGSWWGLMAVGSLIVLFVVRTALEDRTLQKELPGYRDYAEKTRYRLIPLVW